MLLRASAAAFEKTLSVGAHLGVAVYVHKGK